MAASLPQTAQDCCDPCVGQDTVTITGTVGWFSVADLTALRAVAASSINQFAAVGTLAVPVGLYRWNNSSVLADNGTTNIAPSDGGVGRWERIAT
jgi:hypothetical protein